MFFKVNFLIFIATFCLSATAESLSIRNDVFAFPGYTIGVSSLSEIEVAFGKGEWSSSDIHSAASSIGGCYSLGVIVVYFESWSVSPPYTINRMKVSSRDTGCVLIERENGALLIPGAGLRLGMDLREFEKSTGLTAHLNESGEVELSGGMLVDVTRFANQKISARFRSGALVEYELQVEIEPYD